VALLSLGMTGQIAPRLQENLLQLLLSVSEGRSDDAATVAIKIGEVTEQFQEISFRNRIAALVGAQQAATLEQMQIGRVVLEITQASGESGCECRPKLTMLGKTLLNLDVVGRTLDPQFDPNASIRRKRRKNAPGALMEGSLTRHLFGGILELKEPAHLRLPGRVNQILDVVAP